MHWTSMNENEIIKEWADEQFNEILSNKYLPYINNEVDSYWCKYDETDDIKEYNFENIPELKKMLEAELTDDFYKDLLLPLAVAAFKEKKMFVVEDNVENSVNKKEKSIKENNIESDFKIPEFVYMF